MPRQLDSINIEEGTQDARLVANVDEEVSDWRARSIVAKRQPLFIYWWGLSSVTRGKSTSGSFKLAGKNFGKWYV